MPRQRLEFAYDYQSRRVHKVEKSFSAQNNTWSVTSDTRYLYDGWNLIAELAVNQQSGIQNLKSTHAWGLDLSGTTTGAGGVGGLVFTALYSATQTTANNSQPPPTSVLALCYDGNGNVLAYCDAATGQPLGRYEYDPFGRLLLREEDPRIAGRASHLFSTKYLDAETGLSYYGHRFYCAEWARWLNRDPIGEIGGANLNSACKNNTPSNYDVLGRISPDDIEIAQHPDYLKCCKKAPYKPKVGAGGAVTVGLMALSLFANYDEYDKCVSEADDRLARCRVGKMTSCSDEPEWDAECVAKFIIDVARCAAKALTGSF